MDGDVPVPSDSSSSAPASPSVSVPPAPPMPPSFPFASLSQPSLFSSVAPPPPPIVPLTPASVPLSQPVQPPGTELLSSFIGTLEAANRTAVRQNKWTLVLLMPKQTVLSRPAWRFQPPPSIFIRSELHPKFLLWRRAGKTTDAEKYTAFFPVDGLPHVALLDPRSGERLMVWGNDEGVGVEDGRLADSLWSEVQDELGGFLESHQLEDDAVGPLHHQEKSWAVRTRRIESTADSVLPPTSVMDDEAAAIEAAIAASLADVQQQQHESDVENSDMYSSDAESQQEMQQSTDIEEDDVQSDQSTARSLSETLSTPPTPVPPPSQRPMLMPTRGEPVASSMESVSSSYLERMNSCFRSSTDASLMEARRLRQQQDAELAESLMMDQEREKKERDEVRKELVQKQLISEAEARLPAEPVATTECFVIAVRMKGGARIVRRFNVTDLLCSVADFVITQAGLTNLMDNEPGVVIKSPGVSFKNVTWNSSLQEIGLGKRTVFTLRK